jgi:hypothetical protein
MDQIIKEDVTYTPRCPDLDRDEPTGTAFVCRFHMQDKEGNKHFFHVGEFFKLLMPLMVMEAWDKSDSQETIHTISVFFLNYPKKITKDCIMACIERYLEASRCVLATLEYHKNFIVEFPNLFPMSSRYVPHGFHPKEFIWFLNRPKGTILINVWIPVSTMLQCLDVGVVPLQTMWNLYKERIFSEDYVSDIKADRKMRLTFVDDQGMELDYKNFLTKKRSEWHDDAVQEFQMHTAMKRVCLRQAAEEDSMECK